MKHLILFAAWILGSNVQAQAPIAAIELQGMNILYRGYENTIIPAVTNSDGRTMIVSARNASVSHGPKSTYIIKPGNGKTTTISISLIDSDGRTAVIKTVEYRVANLPVPNIYWGDLISGGNGNLKSPCLSVRYPAEIPLRSEFQVLSWETSFENDTISGDGSSLSTAEDFFKKIPSGTTLLFKVVVQSPDGIRRFRHAQWTVMAWNIEKDLVQELNCE